MGMLKNRKGIELSINFIVMLILAIAVFAGGLVFASKFFSHAEDVRGSLDSQTERQLEKLLDSGSPVVLPISSKEIFRNKFDTFGLGVMAKYPGTYTMSIKFKDAFEKGTNDRILGLSETGMLSWLKIPADGYSQKLEKNEKGKYLIGVQVPQAAESGTYIFEIGVAFTAGEGVDSSLSTDEYDAPLQMIVKVP